MLYLRALTLKDFGTKREPNLALRCEFSASSNKYAKTHAVTIFENSSLSSSFAGLVQDFSIEEVDKTIAVNCKEEWSGEVFTAEVAPHYITDSNGEVIERDGQKVVSTTLTAVWVGEFEMTKESVIRSFERTWKKQGLDVPVAEDE